MGASVTVSMLELTIGLFRNMCLESLVLKFTVLLVRTGERCATHSQLSLLSERRTERVLFLFCFVLFCFVFFFFLFITK